MSVSAAITLNVSVTGPVALGWVYVQESPSLRIPLSLAYWNEKKSS